MKLRVAIVFAVLALPRLAHAEDRRRVIVWGPHEDVVAARVEKELGAMGFDVVRAEETADCSRRSVAAHLRDEGADAAACSDGDSVAIWVAEPAGARLRDVIVLRDDDAHAREVAAVRAAEIARASLELAEPPPPPPPSEPAIVPTRELPPDRASRRPRRIPLLLAGAGVGANVNSSATSATLGARLELGVHRYVALAVRGDIPLTSTLVPVTTLDGSSIGVSSGFAGAGVSVPLAPASSFFVPRIGGGFAVLWVNVTSSTIVATPDGGTTTQHQSNGQTSAGAYVDGALSLRMYGPLRVAADGAIGATPTRIVVRDGQLANVASFGRPFGALGLRLELEL